MKRRYVAASGVPDLPRRAVELERQGENAGVQDVVHRVIEHVHVEVEVGTVQVLQGDRNPGSNCQGQKVSIVLPSHRDVQLKVRFSDFGKQNVEVEQALVIQFHLDLHPVKQVPHELSPSVVGGIPTVAESGRWASWLRGQLDSRDWRQRDLVTASGGNIKPDRVSKWLKGLESPSYHSAVAVASAFGVQPLEALFAASFESSRGGDRS